MTTATTLHAQVILYIPKFREMWSAQAQAHATTSLGAARASAVGLAQIAQYLTCLVQATVSV